MNLLDTSQLHSLMTSVQASHLLHLAWNVSPALHSHSWENLRWLRSTLELLESFVEHGGRRAVMAGTCLEYDPGCGCCVEETTPLRPVSPYAICKTSLYEVFEMICQKSALSGAWARIFSLYGPHEHPGRLVSSVILSLLQGRKAKCTHGKQIRDFLHVQDVAAALVALLDSDVQGAVNIASGIPVRVRDLASTIAAKLGVEDMIDFGAVPVAGDEPHIRVADIGRLRDQVGWRPRFDLDSGLLQTINWWKGQLRKDKP